MIHIASRATRAINIPNRKQTRAEIILLFKAQMSKLKDRLNVRVLGLLGSMLYELNLIYLFRVGALRGKLASRATRGRLRTQMGISLLRDTGSKSGRLDSGNLNMLFWVSQE
jgi:hypothetical protein